MVLMLKGEFKQFLGEIKDVSTSNGKYLVRHNNREDHFQPDALALV